ncbi:hypothetical protein NDU88_006494 [Pleurodeles waltl]|uniref:Uncharacterized protein n=1 Tax=Pleurodeles waltl TaxID=8319 RepID=A0AAV7LV25_PLEWA|nr:hypothetical protein NDU88_006494 [Pleurodeles waltl]
MVVMVVGGWCKLLLILVYNWAWPRRRPEQQRSSKFCSRPEEISCIQAISGLPGRSLQTLLPQENPREPWPLARLSGTGDRGDASPAAECELGPRSLLRRHVSSLVSGTVCTAEARAPYRLDTMAVGDQVLQDPLLEGAGRTRGLALVRAVALKPRSVAPAASIDPRPGQTAHYTLHE